jgi:lipopolysaccharide transport system ATP-binding protein
MQAHISAREVSIEFPIYENSHRSLKNTVMHLTTGGRIGNDARKFPIVKALDNLSFEFRHGERVGLVGHNGSGKTTLLRMLSGVYAPVRGELRVEGKIASLLDVSMGLDPDATGFENIYLRGIMDGMMPSEVRARIDEIAEFTELGEYLNLPVRTYSSGMMVRLAFAISTNVEADIILMDEWLSVGDADFRSKATARLEALVDSASILVIASHDFALIDQVCTRKLHLERGCIVSDEPVVRETLDDATASLEMFETVIAA